MVTSYTQFWLVEFFSCPPIHNFWLRKCVWRQLPKCQAPNASEGEVRSFNRRAIITCRPNLKVGVFHLSLPCWIVVPTAKTNKSTWLHLHLKLMHPYRMTWWTCVWTRSRSTCITVTAAAVLLLLLPRFCSPAGDKLTQGESLTPVRPSDTAAPSCWASSPLPTPRRVGSTSAYGTTTSPYRRWCGSPTGTRRSSSTSVPAITPRRLRCRRRRLRWPTTPPPPTSSCPTPQAASFGPRTSSLPPRLPRVRLFGSF